MHEMSLIVGILEIAETEARANAASTINAIELEIGDMAGVEVESLKFCFETARQGTLARDAELVVHRIPGMGHCVPCGEDVPVEGFTVATCPRCQGFVEITQGRELRVKSLNVD